MFPGASISISPVSVSSEASAKRKHLEGGSLSSQSAPAVSKEKAVKALRRVRLEQHNVADVAEGLEMGGGFREDSKITGSSDVGWVPESSPPP